MSKQEAPNPAEEVEIQVPEVKSENIDVTPEPKVQKPEVKPLVDDETKKLHRRMEYQSRQFERAMEEIRNLSTKLTIPAQPKEEVKVDADDVDAVAQQDWKRGVRMVVTPEIEKTVENLLNKRDQERVAKEQLQSAHMIREKAMATVLESHPEIEDEDSDFTRVYTQVLNEDPSLRSNPLGPELAMSRAERRMKTGDRIKVENNMESNTERIARVKSTYPPQGRPPSGEGRIILTSEEKKICDEKGIKYADYTKMRGMNSTNFKEGVTVDE